MAGPQTIMPSSDGRSPFAIFFNGVPQDAPPTTVDVTVRGSQHVATTRFSLQP
jgi:hypothetical protein